MLKNSFFITGTDTNIGKTEITCGFIQFFKNKEKIVFGMKPVAAGTDYINHQKINEDVHKFKTLRFNLLIILKNEEQLFLQNFGLNSLYLYDSHRNSY